VGVFRSRPKCFCYRPELFRTQIVVKLLKEGVEEAMKGTGGARVYIVVDYEDAVLLDDVALDYWKTVNELQREYHLLIKHFHVSSFDTNGQIVIISTLVRIMKPKAAVLQLLWSQRLFLLLCQDKEIYYRQECAEIVLLERGVA